MSVHNEIELYRLSVAALHCLPPYISSLIEDMTDQRSLREQHAYAWSCQSIKCKKYKGRQGKARRNSIFYWTIILISFLLNMYKFLLDGPI